MSLVANLITSLDFVAWICHIPLWPVLNLLFTSPVAIAPCKCSGSRSFDDELLGVLK
jgi:hypothetical protein